MYTSPQGAAGALSFHDPLEGTETNVFVLMISHIVKTFMPAAHALMSKEIVRLKRDKKLS